MRTDKVNEIEDLRISYGFDLSTMINIIENVLPNSLSDEIKNYLYNTCSGINNELLYNEYLAQLNEDYLDDIISEINMIIE